MRMISTRFVGRVCRPNDCTETFESGRYLSRLLQHRHRTLHLAVLHLRLSVDDSIPPQTPTEYFLQVPLRLTISPRLHVTPFRQVVDFAPPSVRSVLTHRDRQRYPERGGIICAVHGHHIGSHGSDIPLTLTPDVAATLTSTAQLQ